jgi:peroxiredoxin
MHLIEMECIDVEWILVAQNRVQCRALVNLDSHKSEQACMNSSTKMSWCFLSVGTCMCLTPIRNFRQEAGGRQNVL